MGAIRDREMGRVQMVGSLAEPSELEEAIAILRRGGLVAFPTETVYGLGARALDPAALTRIFAAKGRPATHPLIAHVLDEAGAQALATEWNARARALAKAFWPGPLTLVVPCRPEVPRELTGGGSTIAVRAPSHPIARALIAGLGEPIAAPSANRYQSLSPTLAEHVAHSLGDSVDLILDGGPAWRGIESTVIDISGPTTRLLRHGAISIKEIRAIVPDVIIANESLNADVVAPSPGLDAKHYAPRARLLLLSREELLRELSQNGTSRRGALLMSALSEAVPSPIECILHVMPNTPVGYAAALFARLHELDDAGVDTILVEQPPTGDAWLAAHDRLARGAWVG